MALFACSSQIYFICLTCAVFVFSKTYELVNWFLHVVSFFHSFNGKFQSSRFNVSLNAATVCKVHSLYAHSLSVELPRHIKSFLFSCTCVLASVMQYLPSNEEDIYSPRDIPRYYSSLSSGSTSSFAHMRALFMSFDFHKLLSATWTNAIA